MSPLLFALHAPLALAADNLPEVAVVGVHVDGLRGDAAEAAADALAAALDATGKVDGVAGAEISRRLAGKESLVVDRYALGQGRERLNEAKVLFAQANAEEAIPKFEESIRLLSDGLRVSTDARDLQDALITLGQSYVGLGNTDAARNVFARLLVIDPARTLDPVKNSPEVLEVFAQARAQADAIAPAELSISATAEARVWIDGRGLGPLPLQGARLPAGEHHVLVRAEDGSAFASTLNLSPGERRDLDPRLSPRSLGLAAPDAAGRSRQSRELYRGVGEYVGTELVLLAGEVGDQQVAVQLYAPRTGSFSRPITGEAGGDPVNAIAGLLPGLVAYVGDNGDVRADRVGTQVVALDVSDNDHLAGLLFNPPEPEVRTVEVRKGPKWYVWAGLGAVVAGGGATAAYVALSSEEPGPSVINEGTIELGPIP